MFLIWITWLVGIIDTCILETDIQCMPLTTSTWYFFESTINLGRIYMVFQLLIWLHSVSETKNRLLINHPVCIHLLPGCCCQNIWCLLHSLWELARQFIHLPQIEKDMLTSDSRTEAPIWFIYLCSYICRLIIRLACQYEYIGKTACARSWVWRIISFMLLPVKWSFQNIFIVMLIHNSSTCRVLSLKYCQKEIMNHAPGSQIL